MHTKVCSHVHIKYVLVLSALMFFIEYKLVQYSERGFAENVPQLTVKGVGLVAT